MNGSFTAPQPCPHFRSSQGITLCLFHLSLRGFFAETSLFLVPTNDPPAAACVIKLTIFQSWNVNHTGLLFFLQSQVLCSNFACWAILFPPYLSFPSIFRKSYFLPCFILCKEPSYYLHNYSEHINFTNYS